MGTFTRKFQRRYARVGGQHWPQLQATLRKLAREQRKREAKELLAAERAKGAA